MKGLEEVAALQAKVEIEGTCSDRFAPVRDAFAHNLETCQDVGASVAVFIDGEPVVDLWAGHFDDTFTRRFERNTIAQNFSSTKTITALCALLLADRGEIDLDAPVARYWPEFDAEGKGRILVRQVLGHTAALCGWDVPMTHRDLYDWEKSTTLLARQAPMWSSPRTSGYHGYTQGHLIGEVVRRVTGKTIGRFLSEEIAGPLGVADDYYIGVPEEADNRVSLLIQGSALDRPNGNRFYDLSLYVGASAAVFIVTVLHGSNDTVVPPAHAHHTAAIVPGATLHMVNRYPARCASTEHPTSRHERLSAKSDNFDPRQLHRRCNRCARASRVTFLQSRSTRNSVDSFGTSS